MNLRHTPKAYHQKIIEIIAQNPLIVGVIKFLEINYAHQLTRFFSLEDNGRGLADLYETWSVAIERLSAHQIEYAKKCMIQESSGKFVSTQQFREFATSAPKKYEHLPRLTKNDDDTIKKLYDVDRDYLSILRIMQIKNPARAKKLLDEHMREIEALNRCATRAEQKALWSDFYRIHTKLLGDN